MGGGEHAERSAPIRAEVLEGISAKSAIPHLFLLDRDERGEAELERLQKSLGGRCHVLAAREVENYALKPRVLRAALIDKCRDTPAIRERVEKATDAEVEERMRGIADGLYGLVLLKRVRSDLPGLRGGLLTRDLITGLRADVQNPELATVLTERLQERVRDHLATLDLQKIVEHHREVLDAAWAVKADRLKLVPGEEVVAGIFAHFGTEYRKPQDTERLARVMQRDEIDPEIVDFINRAVALAGQPGETRPA